MTDEWTVFDVDGNPVNDEERRPQEEPDTTPPSPMNCSYELLGTWKCNDQAEFRVLTGDATIDQADYACDLHVGAFCRDGVHENFYVTHLNLEEQRRRNEVARARFSDISDDEEPF